MESSILIEAMLQHSRNQDAIIEHGELGAEDISAENRSDADDAADEIEARKRRRSAYESEDEDDGAAVGQRVTELERIQRCRERNRVHARNTRERKRAQMDFLQQRIQDLSEEKYRLESAEPDSSVASILMSLSSAACRDGDLKPLDTLASAATHSKTHAVAAQKFASMTMERIKNEISATLSDDEELEMNSDLMGKDRSSCSTQELEMIRRERNRMHAKKTRLRKKKMLTEMEAIIYELEEDIRRLRCQREIPNPPNSTAPTKTSSSSSNSRASPVVANSGKFTGFRHANRMVESGQTTRAQQKEGPPARLRAPSPLLGAAHPLLHPMMSALSGGVMPSGVEPHHMINLPPMFRSVPGIQEAIVEYEKRLMLEMRQKLGSQGENPHTDNSILRSLHNPENVLCSSSNSSMSTGTTHESCMSEENVPAKARGEANLSMGRTDSTRAYEGNSGN